MTATPAAGPFQVTVQPSGRTFSVDGGEAILPAAIRQGIGMPYGCKDGACGSCKCKKLEGTVIHGPHQTKALSPEEEANGLVLTCCAVPQTDIVLESRQVTDESAFPVRKMPSRVTSLEKVSHDVMIVKLQLPANDTLRYHAGQYIEFILRDGAHLLRSEAVHFEHFHDPRRGELPVALEGFHAAGADQFTDLRRDGRADALNAFKLGVGKLGQRPVYFFQREVSVAGGADAEFVLVVEFHQAGEFVEGVGNGAVGHGMYRRL